MSAFFPYFLAKKQIFLYNNKKLYDRKECPYAYRLVKLRIPNLVYRIAQLLEIVVSLFVIAAILCSLVSVAHELGLMVSDPLRENGLHDFLAVAFTVVIGIEFLKMLSRHNMSAVVEVLLFAIARQMVVEHTSAIENLIMVVSIGLLFLIRKFLFIPHLDNKRLYLGASR